MKLNELVKELKVNQFYEDALLSGAVPVEAIAEWLGPDTFLDMESESEIIVIHGSEISVIPYSTGQDTRQLAHRLLHLSEARPISKMKLLNVLGRLDKYEDQLASTMHLLLGLPVTVGRKKMKTVSYTLAELVAELESSKNDHLNDASAEKMEAIIGKENMFHLAGQVLFLAEDGLAAIPHYTGEESWECLFEDNRESPRYLYTREAYLIRGEQKQMTLHNLSEQRAHIHTWQLLLLASYQQVC